MNLLRRLRALCRKEKLDAEMSEEMRAHLELQTAQNIARSMSPDEARYAARRAFGGVEQIKERCRDDRRPVLFDSMLQDFRFALRSLARAPGFTAIAILTLALGIGANTAIFSAVHAILLKSLPFPDSDRLVAVQTLVKRETWERRTTSNPGTLIPGLPANVAPRPDSRRTGVDLDFELRLRLPFT